MQVAEADRQAFQRWDAGYVLFDEHERSIGALMFIEQDVTSIPPLESLAISYRNLQKMLG